MNWQPIEYAPNEGEILVWDGKEVWLVEIVIDKFYPKQNGCGCCSSSINATRWMQLPEPPKGEPK